MPKRVPGQTHPRALSASKVEDLWTTRLAQHSAKIPFSLTVVALCAMQNSPIWFRQLWPILSVNSQAVLNLVDTVLDREHTLALDVAAVHEASQLSFCRAGPTLTKSPSQSRSSIRVFLKPELVDESAPAQWQVSERKRDRPAFHKSLVG